MPTSPSTAALRAWARENDFAIGDRGRIPQTVLDAYQAAHKKADRRTNEAPQVSKPTTAASAAVRKPELMLDEPIVPAADPTQVAALQEQLTQLAARVDKLEQAAAKPARRKFLARR